MFGATLVCVKNASKTTHELDAIRKRYTAWCAAQVEADARHSELTKAVQAFVEVRGSANTARHTGLSYSFISDIANNRRPVTRRLVEAILHGGA